MGVAGGGKVIRGRVGACARSSEDIPKELKYMYHALALVAFMKISLRAGQKADREMRCLFMYYFSPGDVCLSLRNPATSILIPKLSFLK